MTQPRDDKGRYGELHGIRSAKLAERYSDLRTVSGKRLQDVLDAIIDDLGGHEAINAGDRVIMDLLRSKLMVVLRLSEWVDLQSDIIKDGKLLYVLGRDYIRYLESTEKTIDRLYATQERERRPDKAVWIKGVTRD